MSKGYPVYIKCIKICMIDIMVERKAICPNALQPGSETMDPGC